MSAVTLLNSLTQNRLITQADETVLRQAQDSRAFLTSLVRIYEDKTQLYLRACQPAVKKILQTEGVPTNRIDAATVQKIMECALNVFLESNKCAFLPSLRLLLGPTEPSLLDSLGLKTVTESGEGIQEIVQRVFVGYVARYRIFCSVDRGALDMICQDVENAAPEIFPTYLLNAFKIENQFASAITTPLQGISQAEASQLLAAQVHTDLVSVRGAVRGIVFYLGTRIAYSALSDTLKQSTFHHLRMRQAHLDFAGAIAAGYAGEMEQQQRQLEVMQANATALTTAVSQACLPALRLLGVPIAIDHGALDGKIQEIRDALQQNESKRASIDSRIDEARTEANRRIDQWRSSIPDRPVTFGIQIGFRL